MKRQPIPTRALRRLGAAGRSVYAWRDEELLKHVDHDGKLTRVSRALSLTGAWASIAAAGVLAHLGGGWPAAIAVTGILAVGTIFRPWYPWAALAVLGSMAGDTFGYWPLAAALGVALVQSARGAGLARLATIMWLALALLHPGVASAVAVIAGLALLIVQTYKGGAPFGPLSARQLRSKLAPPAPALPWLVARARRRQLANVPPEISRKAAGGYGERATALALLGLPARQRTCIVHDVALPGATIANIDHVLLTRAGLFAIDSKVFRGEIVTEGNDLVRLHEGKRFSLGDTLRSVAWQSTALGAEMEMPTRPVLVIHGAVLRGAIQVAVPEIEGFVTVVSGQDALPYLAQQAAILDGADLSSLEMALGHLRAHGGERLQIIRPLGSRGGLAKLDVHVSTMTIAASGAAPRVGPASPVQHERVPAASPAAVTSAPATLAPAATPGALGLDTAWSELSRATPAPAADVEALGFSALRRGGQVTVFSFEGGELTDVTLTAVSPVLAATPAIPSEHIALAHESAWRVHQETGQPVGFTYVTIDRIMVTPEETQ